MYNRISSRKRSATKVLCDDRRLSNNFFSGSVPESLGMLPNLKELWVLLLSIVKSNSYFRLFQIATSFSCFNTVKGLSPTGKRVFWILDIIRMTNFQMCTLSIVEDCLVLFHASNRLRAFVLIACYRGYSWGLIATPAIAWLFAMIVSPDTYLITISVEHFPSLTQQLMARV